MERIAIDEALPQYKQHFSHYAPRTEHLVKPLLGNRRDAALREVRCVFAAWVKVFNEANKRRDDRQARAFIRLLLSRCGYSSATAALLSVANRNIVENRATLLYSKGPAAEQQAVLNMRAELRLLGIAWLHIFEMLISALDDWQCIRGAMCQAFQFFTLVGEPATIPKPKQPHSTKTVFGRIMDLEQYCEAVALQAGHLPRTTKSQLATSRLLPTEPVELGRFHMWSTFSEVGEPDPFFGLPKRAAELSCRLGLPDDAAKYVCLRYHLPAKVIPRVPTVADAYAGRNWNYYFRTPPSPNDPYGRTMPAPTCASTAAQSVPECVHEVITSRSLVTPPERLS